MNAIAPVKAKARAQPKTQLCPQCGCGLVGSAGAVVVDLDANAVIAIRSEVGMLSVHRVIVAPREARVAHVLASSIGLALNRSDIHAAVFDETVGPRNVDTAITRLRPKLAPLGIAILYQPRGRYRLMVREGV